MPGEILEILGGFAQRLYAHKWAFLIISGIYTFIYLKTASVHISTFTERDRWILENSLPVLPYDPPVPSRLALVISWFTQPDIAVPLVGLVFVIFWFAFLIHVNNGEFPNFAFWGVLFVFTFLNGTIFQLMYASMELPAAILSFVGLYGIWKGKYNLGLLFLVVGGSWKNTGVFQIATGLVLFLFLCWEERSLLWIFRKIDISLLVIGAIYLALNHWGSFYYALEVRGGPDYLVNLEDGHRIFWVSSFGDFMYILFKNYTPLAVLGLAGMMFDKRVRTFSLFSVGILMFLRCFQEWNDDGYPLGYSMIFIPGLSFFSARGLGFLSMKIKARWIKGAVAVFLIILGAILFAGRMEHFPYGMTRLNSNFDQYIGRLTRRFPEVGRIYQRDISLKPYFTERLGQNLNAIEFWAYPEERGEFISELSQPGCKLIIAVREHLAFVGITEVDITSMGYSERPYILTDQSGTWMSYSKECNAWEYEP